MPNSELTPELLEEMKRELLQLKAAFSRSVSTELSEMSNREHHHLADMSEAGDASDEERSFRLLELGAAELQQVEEALDQIAAGTYGTCENCQRSINLERLKALPFATKCITCKREEESSESEGLS